MTRKTTLTITTLIAFYYCLRFGYIWTAYGHGGQILGIPFALGMLIITILFFTSKTHTRKDKIFNLGIVYFLTLAAFSITIETIRATMKNYFEFLYFEPGGYVDKIFLSWLILGTVAFIFILRQLKRKQFEQNKI
jgi:hypothetical protein